MKKICLLNFGKVINSTGGAEKVLCDFANEFSKRGYDITIICSENTVGKTYFLLDDNVRFVNLGIETRFTFIEKIIKKICCILKINYSSILNNSKIDTLLHEIIEKESFDIVVNFFPRDLIYVLKNFSRIPIVQMLHGSADWLLQNSDFTVKENIEKTNMLQVLLPSYALKLEGICVKKEVIPNIVKQEQRIAKYSRKIVYLSRYDVNKQIHLLVEAFGKCASNFVDWELHIYGSDWTPGYRYELQNIINNLCLEKQCFLHGRTNKPIDVLVDASICAFPSKYEGFPLALTEAMSLGLPCIGFKSCTGVNELIEDSINGFLVNDVKEFTAKLCVLMSNQDLCIKYGMNAREKMKNYDPVLIWNRWNDALEHIINKG